MSGFSLWELDMRELIRDFSEQTLSAESAVEFLEGLGLGRIVMQSSPMSAEKLLMVYSHTDYAFTTDDLGWLSAAPVIISGSCENGLQVYAVELLCDKDDYYISCAAIIKLVNTIIPGANFFLFKVDDSFALGTARSLENTDDNSFCVTGLINRNNVVDFIEFFDELTYCSPNEIPWAIMRYSPQEDSALIRDYDQRRTQNPDYLTFLDEVESFYGESAESERKRFFSELEAPEAVPESYKDTSKQLAMVARKDNATSYDVLERAEEAERKAVHLSLDPTGANKADLNELDGYDYPDADKLLEEVLNEGFSTGGKE